MKQQSSSDLEVQTSWFDIDEPSLDLDDEQSAVPATEVTPNIQPPPTYDADERSNQPDTEAPLFVATQTATETALADIADADPLPLLEEELFDISPHSLADYAEPIDQQIAPSTPTREPAPKPDPDPVVTSETDLAATPTDVAEAQTQLVTRLFGVASQLTGEIELDTLLHQAITKLVATLPMFRGGMIWLYEPRLLRLQLSASAGLEFDTRLEQVLHQIQLRPGEGLTGEAFQSDKPLIVRTQTTLQQITERLRQPHRATLLQDLAEDAPPFDVVYVPLRTSTESLGVIILLHWQDAHAHVEEEHTSTDAPLLHALTAQTIELLRHTLPTFAALLANTIHARQLYAQELVHRNRLDAFDAVVTAISTATDLHDMLSSVLDVIMGILPVSAGAIFTLDPIREQLLLSAHRNLPAPYLQTVSDMAIGGSMCEEVIRYGQPALRPLIEDSDEMPLLQNGLESCAYLPLLAGGTVVGALGLYGNAYLYKEVDMTRLMPLGNQVGFAIANVRLYQDSNLERYKLNTVINSIAEGVVLCDSRGRLLLANEAAMELLSLEVVPYDQPLSEMPDFYGIRDLEAQPLPVEQLPLARALSGETFHDYRVLQRGVSGEDTVMSFSGSPVRTEGDAVEGAVVVFRDITALYKQERAKDDFLATTAHELRSPLAAVRSYADLLLRREQQRTEGDGRDLRGLTILSQQVGHMLRMVDNLLDVSRLDAGQLDLQRQPVNLVVLAGQVLDQLRPSSANHELVLASGCLELWVQCDSMRVQQVLTNLVNNAIKYSPPDTRVTVTMSTRTTPRSEAVVCVIDEGDGVPPTLQNRLFQRFSRVKSNRRAEGLGLGLYLSREFVQMHGGHIWVESEPGQGSTFCFALPLEEEE